MVDGNVFRIRLQLLRNNVSENFGKASRARVLFDNRLPVNERDDAYARKCADEHPHAAMCSLLVMPITRRRASKRRRCDVCKNSCFIPIRARVTSKVNRAVDHSRRSLFMRGRNCLCGNKFGVIRSPPRRRLVNLCFGVHRGQHARCGDYARLSVEWDMNTGFKLFQ